MKVRAIQVTFNDLLPEDLRDYTRPIDKKFITDALRAVAQRYPNQYEKISKDIVDLGRELSFTEGETIRLDDLKSPMDKHGYFAKMDAELAEAENNPASTPEQLRLAKETIHGKYANLLESATMEAGQRTGNAFVRHVASGARGNPFQVKALLTTPAIYTDYKDRQIPIFIRNSFSEGLRPHEFYASTFGTRKGVVSTKVGTADAGDFGKQLAVASENMIVTEEDCGTTNGIPVRIDDDDNTGGVLAHAAGKFPAGSIVTKDVLESLQKDGVDNLIMRSPLTCRAAHGGICSHCAGIRETGTLPHIGDNLGVSASQAISEPIAQGNLNVKHTAGGLSGKKKIYSGFPVLNQLAQSPETFPDRAVVSEEDGMVDEIKPAPQGGNYVTVNGHAHYVHPEYELTVSHGDRVEAGDQLSDGVIDPADIVRLKGLGEGRRYFVERMRQALKDNGTPAHRRNVEIVGRSLMNHVRITNPDGLGDYLPDDVANYNTLSLNYKPRAGSLTGRPDDMVGKFLEYPVLHHTIGTRITPNLAEDMKKTGIESITAHENPPEFESEMVRLRAATQNSTDWMAKLHSSYLQKNLLVDVGRGRSSPMHSTHPVPSLARGVEFARPPKGEVGY